MKTSQIYPQPKNSILQNPNNQPSAFPYLSLLNYKHRRALSINSLLSLIRSSTNGLLTSPSSLLSNNHRRINIHVTFHASSTQTLIRIPSLSWPSLYQIPEVDQRAQGKSKMALSLRPWSIFHLYLEDCGDKSSAFPPQPRLLRIPSVSCPAPWSKLMGACRRHC